MDLEKEIKRYIRDYLKINENVYQSERLFIAKSVLLWALKTAQDQKIFTYYLKEIEKHLNGEITLYWKDGIVKVKKKEKQEQT